MIDVVFVVSRYAMRVDSDTVAPNTTRAYPSCMMAGEVGYYAGSDYITYTSEITFQLLIK
jgi:hypothetical protein